MMTYSLVMYGTYILFNAIFGHVYPKLDNSYVTMGEMREV